MFALALEGTMLSCCMLLTLWLLRLGERLLELATFATPWIHLDLSHGPLGRSTVADATWRLPTKHCRAVKSG